MWKINHSVNNVTFEPRTNANINPRQPVWPLYRSTLSVFQSHSIIALPSSPFFHCSLTNCSSLPDKSSKECHTSLSSGQNLSTFAIILSTCSNKSCSKQAKVWKPLSFMKNIWLKKSSVSNETHYNDIWNWWTMEQTR